MASTWCNPLLRCNAPDPFILRVEEAYFLFATGRADDGRFIPVRRSCDLATWEPLGGAVAAGPAADSWNRRNFWAPEVIADGGLFWLYYTAMPDTTPRNIGNRIGVAVADRPQGPYQDRGPLTGYAALDASPFRDRDGTLYLYHTAEFGSLDDQAGQPSKARPSGGGPPLVPGRIYVDRLIAPDRLAGEPCEVMGQHSWQEGPVALHRFGRYLLFYSTGNWGDGSYGVRWAEAASPLGPFVEQPTPLLRTTEQVRGPGHHNFFTGPDGGDWMVYHGWDPAGTARMARIDRLIWRDGRPVTDGPTATPQPL